MKIQYSEKVDRVIYGKDISEIKSVNEWIDLIEACLDQSNMDDIAIYGIEERLEYLREECKGTGEV